MYLKTLFGDAWEWRVCQKCFLFSILLCSSIVLEKKTLPQKSFNLFPVHSEVVSENTRVCGSGWRAPGAWTPQEHPSLCWHFLTRGLGLPGAAGAGHGHYAKTRPQHLHCVFPLRWIGKIKKNESVFEAIQHCLGLNGRMVFQGTGKTHTQIFRTA